MGILFCLTCQAEIKTAFYTPDKLTREVEEKISKCFEKDRNIRIERITKITRKKLRDYQVLILWGTRINCKSSRRVNRLDKKRVGIIRNWVKNGGGLLCFHSAVGLKKHDSQSMFPEVGEGIDNHYPDRKPFVRECVVSRSHPIMNGIPEGSRFTVSYFDFITIRSGEKGVPLLRRVTKLPIGGVVDDPLLVTAQIGKGRYVACGLATGLHASNTPVEPVGPELRILKNAVNWLAESGKTEKSPAEVVKKGEILKTRNLVSNSSVEKVKYGYPIGWGKGLSSGKFEWGVSEKEKHSGQYSVYVIAKDYYTDPKSGMKSFGGGIQTDKSYSVARPNTEYKFSFWMKTTAPYIRLWFNQVTSEKKHIYAKPTSLDWLKPNDDQWHEYSGKFITGPKTTLINLSFYIAGRKNKWGRNPAIPLGTVLYLDDVTINESASVSPITELQEKNFIRMKTAGWKKSTGNAPELHTIPPETPLEFNEEYLKLPAFKNLPSGCERISLNGLWKIKKFYGLKNAAKEKTTGVYRLKDAETDDPGLESGFWQQNFNDSDWAQRHVPSSWYSDDTPEKSRKSGKIRNPRSLLKEKPAPWIGWYRREFELPDIEKGKRTILHFERVSYKCEIWVNGQKTGKHTGGRTPFSVDISDAVKPGEKNILAVRIFDPIKVYDSGHWVAGGIWDIVYIDILPGTYSHRANITPKLKESLIEVEAWINNTTGKEYSSQLTAVIKSYPTPYSRGPEYNKTSDLGKHVFKSGMNKYNFSIPLEKPVYWTPENPYLYTLELQIGNEFINRDRFGFRSFIAKGPDFLLNGKPVYLRGECVNSLRLEPSLINSDDKEFIFMKKYLMAKKMLNINNLYSMITPLPESIYNVLDEIGLTLYVDWHAAQPHWPMNEPIESEKELREMEAWVYYAYNHPAQSMWSLGGELYEHYYPKFARNYDEVLNPLYDMIKRIDKQNRPVCQSSGRIPRLPFP